MKILFLDTSPIRRGAQVFIAELGDALDQRGDIQNYRFYLYKAQGSASLVKIRNQDCVLGFNQAHIFEKIPTLQPRILYKLIIEIRRIQPDVVLLNGSRTLKYGAAIKHFLPKKIKWISRIIDSAEFWNSGKFTHWYYKNLVIPQLDGTIGVSKSSLDSMIRHYNFQKPSVVIHRVIDPNKFRNAPSRDEARKQLGLRETDEVLLFLGNLTTQKRPDRFIEIVQNLSQTRPHLKALIVGDGPLREELESRIASVKNQETGPCIKSDTTYHLPLTTYITFYGYQQDVSRHLTAADILILTSDTEGLPGVVLEAAHFNVPTVTSEVGGIRECFVDGVTGFLIPDRSVGTFCEKINLLFENPSQRMQLGQNAKIFISQHFHMERAAHQYLDFFKIMLASS